MKKRLAAMLCAFTLVFGAAELPVYAENKDNTSETETEALIEEIKDELIEEAEDAAEDTGNSEDVLKETEVSDPVAELLEDKEELLEGEGLLNRPENYTGDLTDSEAELDEYVEVNAEKIDGNEVVKYIYKSLRDYLGFNHAAACAVIANARHESNFNYTVVGDGGTSYGIFQWHAGRWNSLKAWCTENGYDWKNADGQMAYFRHELENGYEDVLDYLLALDDSDVGAFDGAYYMCVHFEKPADTYGQANARGKEAIEFFGMEELRNSYREAVASDDDTKGIWDLSNY